MFLEGPEEQLPNLPKREGQMHCPVQWRSHRLWRFLMTVRRKIVSKDRGPKRHYAQGGSY